MPRLARHAFAVLLLLAASAAGSQLKAHESIAIASRSGCSIDETTLPPGLTSCLISGYITEQSFVSLHFEPQPSAAYSVALVLRAIGGPVHMSLKTPTQHEGASLQEQVIYASEESASSFLWVPPTHL